MNFIPPTYFQDDAPPIKYVPQESKSTKSKSTEPRSASKLQRKKSLTSLWHRNDRVEDPPAVPEIPAAFKPPSIRMNETTTTSVSLNETSFLAGTIQNNPTPPDGLVVSGVSFMNLTDSASGSSESQRAALLNRLRRAVSKTDLTTQNETPTSASKSSPSLASLDPSSRGTDSSGILRRLTDAENSTAPRKSIHANRSSADQASPRSSPLKQPPFPHVKLDPCSSALGNPPLDPEFEFNDFITSNKPQTTHSPRMDTHKPPSRNAPPIDSPRGCKYETVSVQATRESVDGYASFLSQPRLRGLPMPDMIEKDEGEWNRAVDWVRGQEAARDIREAKAVKADGKKIKSEMTQQTRQEIDRQVKVDLAKQFIRRTSTSWTPRRDSHELGTDEASCNAIAEALHLASKHETTSDPGLTELRHRFFAGIASQFSRSQDGKAPKSAPLPSRSGRSNSSTTGSFSTPIRGQQYARSSTATEQTFATCPVSPVGSGRLRPEPTPSPRHRLDKDENAHEGLGIDMKAADQATCDTNAIDGHGTAVLAVPASPGFSLRSQRNAFSSEQSSSSLSPKPSPRYPNSEYSLEPASCTVIDDAESRERLQSSASATLANTRIFKIDRDSKVQDRYVPKRGSALYQTLDAARELAEARLGLAPTGPLPLTPLPRKDSMLESSPTPVKKTPSNSSGHGMFKRATKHPALRAMVSSLSLRSPDATEMVQSPVTPTIAIHPAFRSASSTPVTPTTKGHHQTMAQMFTGKPKTPRASTSTMDSDPALCSLSVAGSKSSSQTSSKPAVPGEDRWAQRVRQKSKVEQAWKEQGIITAPVKQPPLEEVSDSPNTTRFGKVTSIGLSEYLQQSSIETPPSPLSLPSALTATSNSGSSIGQSLSPRLSRKTQDSPTPLNIRKVSASPNLQLGLSPGSPISLHLPKIRTHPAVRRVLEQDLKNSPEVPTLSPSVDGDRDPFAKSGSSGRSEEDWPLSDTSTNNETSGKPQSYQRSPLDGQFDTLITTWRHASAKQESLPSSPNPTDYAENADKHRHVREYLELDRLHASSSGKAHPNHPYEWASINVMCKDIHNDAQLSSDASTEGTGDGSVRFCSFCRETCCYFGLQMGRTEIQAMGRDQSLEELKNKARSHVFFLRGACPTGIEDYQVLMECGLCDRLSCPSCASICQYPFCTRPVCKACVEFEDGICSQH